jgi:hypothetical protein
MPKQRFGAERSVVLLRQIEVSMMQDKSARGIGRPTQAFWTNGCERTDSRTVP